MRDRTTGTEREEEHDGDKRRLAKEKAMELGRKEAEGKKQRRRGQNACLLSQPFKVLFRLLLYRKTRQTELHILPDVRTTS